jgi:hypothetical protein
MRAARSVIAIIGILIVVVFATIELASVSTPMPIRMWLMTAILLSLVGTVGLLVIERQCHIIKELSVLRGMILYLVTDTRSARTVEEFKRRFNSTKDGGDQNTNVRHLFPEE